MIFLDEVMSGDNDKTDSDNDQQFVLNKAKFGRKSKENDEEGKEKESLNKLARSYFKKSSNNRFECLQCPTKNGKKKVV